MREECGQAMAVLGLGIFLLVGLAGVSIEVGHGYYALELLQASTNAATLAAASGLPSGPAAQAYADQYSSLANQENRAGILQNVTLTVTPYCSSLVSTDLNVPCQSATSGAATYNAVKVVQTAITPLWFGPFGHVPLFNLSATGTAAMAGGVYPPYNIAVVMDTTASMGGTDKTGQCSGTQETCALAGFRTLLGIALPCESGQTCASVGSSPDDAISLFVFPPILNTSVSSDTDCSSGSPAAQKYIVPTLPTTPAASAVTYQVIPFSGGDTYRVSDTAQTLNAGDPLVMAAGGPQTTGGSNCSGLGTPGGAGTYYAQAIYAAGAALQVQQAGRPGSANILILLSDGNATSTTTYTGSGKTAVFSATSQLQPSSPGSLNGITGNNPTSPTYPSAVGECGQAVQAAADVATQTSVTIGGTAVALNNTGQPFTQVYTIGYGSPNSADSSDCASDQTYTATVTAPSVTAGTWPSATGPGESSAAIKAKSPCAALAAMATTEGNFFSDDSNGCKASSVPNAGITSLSSIFGQIISSLAHPKLIPNGSS
jgi:Flp pilus assembly protein TadG